MAASYKITVAVPARVRDLHFEVTQLLNQQFGCLMSAEISVREDETGTGKIVFPGNRFTCGVSVWSSHFGEHLGVNSIKAVMAFYSKDAAEEWVNELQKFAGPIEWKYEKEKLRFEISTGITLSRLAMNASNRRNGIPTYEWDAVDHPLNQRAA